MQTQNLDESQQVRDRCAAQVAPAVGEPSWAPLSISWGDWVAAMALAMLAYVLGNMGWDVFHRF